MRKKFNDDKILIIGGLGYLGANLYSFLKKKNFNVFIGARNISKENILESNLNIIEIDTNNEKKLIDSLKTFGIIIYSAGANSERCKNDLINSIKTNINQKALVGKASVISGVKRFINISTAHIYGELNGSIYEDLKSYNKHPYGYTNLIGELSLNDICRNTNTKIINLRLSNVFGPPKIDNYHCWKLFVNNSCQEAFENKKITIKNNHLIERNFLGLNDFCKIMEFFINCENKKIIFDTYNIGSNESMTLERMAQIIQLQISKDFKFKPEIIYKSKALKKEKLDFSISRIQEIYKIEYDPIYDIKRLLNFVSR